MKTRMKKEDKIREAAYYLWLNNPNSTAEDNWLEAEKNYKCRHTGCCGITVANVTDSDSYLNSAVFMNSTTIGDLNKFGENNEG